MKLRVVMAVGVAVVGIASPAFAQLPVPTVVQVPTVQAPVPVPTIQVPVPVPTVRVPVPVPTVQVPVPTVQVPDIPLPVPTTAPPRGGGGGSGGGGSSGAAAPSASSGSGSGSGSGSPASGGGSGAASSGGGSGASSSAGGGGSQAASPGGGSGSPSSGGGGSRAASPGGGSGASSSAGPARSAAGDRSTAGTGAAATHARRRSPAQRCAGRRQGALRRDCELRETVADTSRCLGDLSTGQRRVLTLRAGVGAGAPRSRDTVARRLRISERRVARLERTGLRRLRTLGQAGACAPPAGQTVAVVDVAAGTAGAVTAANPGRAGQDEAPRAKRLSNTPSEPGSDSPGDGVPPLGGIAGESVTNPSPGTISLTLPLILLVLAAGAVVLIHRLRRETAVVPAGEVTSEDRPGGPAWIPWHRSTMRGPGWNDPRPPTDRPGEWSYTPRRSPAPEPEQDEAWTPPTHRSPTRRR